MKTIRTIVGCIGLTLLLGACSSDKDTSCLARKSLTFSSNINALQTRVVDNNWEKQDAIGVYALDPSEGGVFDDYQNIEYLAQAQGANVSFNHAPANEGILLNKLQKVSLKAYYPYQPTVANFTLPIDVSETKKEVDVLYAEHTQAVDINEVPVLTFNHVLSKIQLLISVADKEDNEIESLENLVVNKLVGGYAEGSLNVLDGVLTKGVKGEIKPDVTYLEEQELVVVTAYVIPEESLDGLTFVMNLNNQVINWSPTLNNTIESGKYYTFKEALYKEKEKITIVTVEGTIQDWELGYESEKPHEWLISSTPLMIPSRSKLYFDGDGGTETLTIKKNNTLKWKASLGDTYDWIKFNSTNHTLEVLVDGNYSNSKREGTLVLEADGIDPVEIQIYQEPSKRILVFRESFGNREVEQVDGECPTVDGYQSYDNKKIKYSASSNVTIQSSSSFPSHLYMPKASDGNRSTFFRLNIDAIEVPHYPEDGRIEFTLVPDGDMDIDGLVFIFQPFPEGRYESKKITPNAFNKVVLTDIPDGFGRITMDIPREYNPGVRISNITYTVIK